MNRSELETTARELVVEGKGILAADESTNTIKKRLESVGVESTEENRRRFREMLFTTPGIEDFISGVILFDETIRQNGSDGRPLRDILRDKGIIPGIKVDLGTQDLANFPGDEITVGLDTLRERLAEYKDLGARFTKWRAVFKIGDETPSRTSIESNADILARYAAISQEAGLVPIVEPEVVMEGDHSIERTREVTEDILRSTFSHLKDHGVFLEGMLLKPNMVIAGKDNPEQATVNEVAEKTLDVLKKVVPPEVPGVVFLSGGQDPVEATEHLNLMNQMGGFPWRLTFSYSRALQGPPLKAWSGNDANVPEAQRVFYQRAMSNSAASKGQYTGEMERKAA